MMSIKCSSRLLNHFRQPLMALLPINALAQRYTTPYGCIGLNGTANHRTPPHLVDFDQKGSTAYAQVTPLDVPPLHHVPPSEDPLVVPQVPLGAPMEVVMAALVNTINRQGQLLHKQADNMRGQNDLIREQNRRIQAVENPHAASKILQSTRRHRSPTPENKPLAIERKNRTPPPRNNRSPPRRNNLSPPRNGEAVARGGTARHSPRRESSGSGDERHRGHLSRRIMDIPLPRGLEKPPSLDKYDGTTDHDEHIQSVETTLGYRNMQGEIKCKLLSLSLIRGASTWWRNLPLGSINSWEELCRMFTAHFTTSRRHPKTVANLKEIIQGPEESLRSYIERFNKVSFEVDATDKMKLYLLEEGLREVTKFHEAVGIVEMETLDEFFELAQRYIKWEETQKASEVRRPKNFEVAGPSSQREERRGDEKKREGGKVREAKPSKTEFKSAGIRFPKQLPAKLNVDKKKFCRFHKSYGHVTDDCVHLKDAIEILIQKGYARQYVDGQPRTANNPPRQNQLAVDPASPEQNVEEVNIVIGGVALAISRPEDFLPLRINEEKEALDYLSAHLGGSWENFPGALVISGGGFNPITIRSIKRKFDEEEDPEGSPNFQIPLLVKEKMANFDAMKSVKVKFLVVDFPSLYNCIIGRPTLAELFAVSSTIHLKLKYYTKDEQVARINGDIEPARRCFEAAVGTK
ncbi:hypothetical protein TSUD_406240 [Trifolium subterraneum]|uniref:Retrotransposon gag domain-containing protein n=1 Tax=Trifolium subterraneum TaxID=3900 RepID=A0A2Z6NX33_TRISU|nr:hypothetical protein TSUD_406240 [Trifolium subterraneum]